MHQLFSLFNFGGSGVPITYFPMDIRRVVDFFSLFSFLFIRMEWQLLSSLRAGLETRH